MEELNGIYEEFKIIELQYEGVTTNWKEKYVQLDRLYHKVSFMKIRSSKNSSFYNWIKRQLSSMIYEERNRVYKLSLKD